jgi:hypothetical protein
MQKVFQQNRNAWHFNCKSSQTTFMKKNIIPVTLLFLLIGFACGTKDNKNEVENYPTYDTNQPAENRTTAPPDSSSLNSPKDQGDIN